MKAKALSEDTHERFFFEGNFTMWQPCMTELQGSESWAAALLPVLHVSVGIDGVTNAQSFPSRNLIELITI